MMMEKVVKRLKNNFSIWLILMACQGQAQILYHFCDTPMTWYYQSIKYQQSQQVVDGSFQLRILQDGQVIQRVDARPQIPLPDSVRPKYLKEDTFYIEAHRDFIHYIHRNLDGLFNRNYSIYTLCISSNEKLYFASNQTNIFFIRPSSSYCYKGSQSIKDYTDRFRKCFYFEITTSTPNLYLEMYLDERFYLPVKLIYYRTLLGKRVNTLEIKLVRIE